ncbi:MAG: hypothetical protein ABJG68_09815 [Crocinitomicaceae bacterium]
MKKIFGIIIVIQALVLGSCGMNQGSFNKQKHTKLKQLKSNNTDVILDNKEPESNQAVLNIDSFLSADISHESEPSVLLETAIEIESVSQEDQREILVLTLNETENVQSLPNEVQENDLTENLWLNREKLHVKSKLKSTIVGTKSIATISLFTSLVLLFGALIAVILLGGLTSLILVAIFFGVALLMTSLLLYIKAGKENKESAKKSFYRKGWIWFVSALLMLGVGVLLTLVLWMEIVFIIAAIIALGFMAFSIINFVKGMKAKK